MARRLETKLGSLHLKNPIIAGAGEHLMTASGIRAAIDAGASVVVAKSFNETEAAKDQLDRTDYALIDSNFQRLKWDFAPPRDATLACRSGLTRVSFDAWLETIASLDREAAKSDCIVAANIILADLDAAVAMARKVEQAGVRLLEFNFGTPYGDEAGGAVSTERSAGRVTEIVSAVTGAIDIPVWAKITGQSENVTSLARAARDGGADCTVLMGRYMGLVPDLESMAPLLDSYLGIGGAWSLPLTCYWLSRTRKALGPDIPLIAINGGRSGLDIARFMLAGAHAAELCTAVMTGGFRVIEDAVAELSAYLDKQDCDAADIIGRAADRVKTFQELPPRPGFWKDFVPPETLAES